MNFLEYHKDEDHAIIINIKRSVSGILHTFLGTDVFWKVHIQLDIAPDSTYELIRRMYKDLYKDKVIRRYTEYLALHNGAPTVQC